MKSKKAALFLAIMIGLTACQGNGPQTSEGSESSAVSSEESEYVIPSQVENKDSKELTQLERNSVYRLLINIEELPRGTAGSSLEVASVFANLANNYGFYKTKADNFKEIVKNHFTSDKRDMKAYKSNLKMIKEMLKTYEEDPEMVKGLVKDSGNELKPTLEIEEMSGLLSVLDYQE